MGTTATHSSKMPIVREVSLPFPTALCMLLQSYVEAINSGRLPCLEGAAAVMMANENAAAVAAALEAYTRGMRGLSLPKEPAQLSAAHGEHLHEALIVFQRRSFQDRDQEHQRRLMVHGPPLPLGATALPLSSQPCSYPHYSHDLVIIATALPIPWHPVSTNLSTQLTPHPCKAALVFMTLSPFPQCSPTP